MSGQNSTELGPVTIMGEEDKIYHGRYPHDSRLTFVSIGTNGDENSFDVITRCVPDFDLGEGEILIATYGHMSFYKHELLATGYFEYLRSREVGRGLGEIWRIQRSPSCEQCGSTLATTSSVN